MTGTASVRAMPGGDASVLEAGLPYITLFDHETYLAGRQNWKVAQHPDGRIFVANNSSILEYDGSTWRRMTVNLRRVNSLDIDSRGRVWVGAVGEIGYLHPDTTGRLEYRSMVNEIPEDFRDFSDVWNTAAFDGSVYFRTVYAIYRWDGTEFSVIESEQRLRHIIPFPGALYIYVSNTGLKSLNENGLSPLPGTGILTGSDVVSVLPYKGNEMLIGTDNGFFLYDGTRTVPYPTELDGLLSRYNLYKGIALNENLYAFATLSGGVFVMDDQGRHIQTLNKENGLPSDVIYNLFTDSRKGLWAAMDDGLARVEILSPFSVFDQRNNFEGNVLDIIRHNDTLYVGSTSGLFYLDRNSAAFTRIPAYSSWVRQLIEIDGSIWVAGGIGIGILSGDEITSVYPEPVYRIHPSEISENLIFFSSRTQLNTLQRKAGGWEVSAVSIETGLPKYTFTESRPGTLWMGYGTDKISKLEYTAGNSVGESAEIVSFTDYGQDHGLHGTNINVYSIGSQDRVAGRRGLLRFNPENDLFIHDTSLAPELAESDRYIFRMSEDAEGNIWLRSNSYQQLLRAGDDGGFEFEQVPFNRMGSQQVNIIYPEPGGTVWFGGNQNIVRYDDNHQYEYASSHKAYIREVLLHRDSLIFSGQDAVLNNPALPVFQYENNEMRFRYALAALDNPGANTYQVKMEPFDTDWSAWTEESMKDYTNLREGNYRFNVRGRDVYGTVSEADVFAFRILPPWYRTWWAYLSLFCLIASFLYSLHRYRSNQLLRVERTRNRIARDLHDEVSATLSSISFFAQAVEQRKPGSSGNRKKYLKLITDSAMETQEKISDIIWSISPDHDHPDIVFARFRRYAADLFESKGITSKILMPENTSLKNLEMEIRQNLWLIFKEMVTNAARHSGCRHVDIVMEINKSRLYLKVADNGKGFAESARFEGYGLKNIRSRADQLGADLKVHTAPGQGTTWEMRVKV